MSRKASYPLPLLDTSARRLRLRCAICFQTGASVRVGDRLLCGPCFHDDAISEEAKRLDGGERDRSDAA
jgi:hypothetical protein